ncbi:hypothetical protein HMPREF9120_02632 [Neisseria sp. oral taxon 020 str. F0370]|nr:hypothetical protein HMPREF9120_02632 [Neisseria sp. oral taxon 020 str. F0370]
MSPERDGNKGSLKAAAASTAFGNASLAARRIVHRLSVSKGCFTIFKSP